MANTYNTLADLVKLNDQNARDMGISDLLNDAPVLGALHATPASNGTNHHFIKQTSAPVVGFRAVNTGKFLGASGYAEVDIALKLMDATTVIDKAIADNYRYGNEKFVERESISALQQSFFVTEQQMWYGTAAGAAAGFSGLGDDVHYNAAAGTLVVNAGGTSAGTGSSIWLIRSTPDEKSMAAVIGNSGTIEVGDTVQTLKADDADPTKSYPAYMTAIMGYVAIQIGGVFSAVRIANLTAETNKGATDALISTALSLFPANRGPTLIAMNRRSLGQLQKSRTATNPTGTPAPFPQDSFGIPIKVTDSISSTETLLA